MQKQSGGRVSAGDVFSIVLSVIPVGLVVGIAGLIVGLALDIVGVRINGSLSYLLFTNGLWVGAVLGLLMAAVRIANRIRSQRTETLAAREAADRRHEEALARTSDRIRGICSAAVDTFEQLPEDLKNARGWTAAARTHFRNGAYSPFWQTIENAYACLGCYNERIAQIESLAREYRAGVSSFYGDGGAGAIQAFPIELDRASAAEAAEPIARALSTAVYTAQREAVFAQIWEQRRTTAAVVRGFANLETAVDRMSSALSASIGSMSGSLGSLASSMHSVRASAAASAALGSAQLRTQEQLNARMDKAVYFLREEHKRAVGLQ